MAKRAAVKKESVIVIDNEADVQPGYKTPATFLQMAIEKNLGMDQLEKFMTLYERWLKMKSLEMYNIAFSKFQSLCPDLKRTTDVKIQGKDGKRGPEYKYQQLGELGALIKTPLAKCGLAYKWVEREDGNKMYCKCVVTHAGGHMDEGNEISGLPDDTGSKNPLQAKRSTLAYLRRTTLEGILGLSSANTDDDGQGSAPREQDYGKPTMDDSQLAAAMHNIMSGKWTIAMVKEMVHVTGEQEEQLRKAEKNYMDKMSKP